MRANAHLSHKFRSVHASKLADSGKKTVHIKWYEFISFFGVDSSCTQINCVQLKMSNPFQWQMALNLCIAHAIHRHRDTATRRVNEWVYACDLIAFYHFIYSTVITRLHLRARTLTAVNPNTFDSFSEWNLLLKTQRLNYSTTQSNGLAGCFGRWISMAASLKGKTRSDNSMQSIGILWNQNAHIILWFYYHLMCLWHFGWANGRERKGSEREQKWERVKKMELKSSMKKMPMEFQQRSTEQAIKTKM